MSTVTVYLDISTVADEIRNDDGFNELINELADHEYDYIEQSDEELTEAGKALIKKMAKQIEEMEKGENA